MTMMRGEAAFKSLTLVAAVTRCGCTPAQKAHPDWHGNHARPCPHPRVVDDLGTIAYSHRNPLRVLAWRVRRYFKR